MAARRIFHCSVIFLFLLSFYILFKAFPDENESHFSGIITSALKIDSATVREVTEHEPLWSVLGCWDRHLELYVYTHVNVDRDSVNQGSTTTVIQPQA